MRFFRLCPIVAVAVNVSPLLERILLLVDAVSSNRQPLHRCSAIFDTSIGLWERGDVLRCRYDGRIAEECIPRESVDAVVTLDLKKYLFERRTMALRESEDVCICGSLLIGSFFVGKLSSYLWAMIRQRGIRKFARFARVIYAEYELFAYNLASVRIIML